MLTPAGRRTLTVIYFAAGTVSVATYVVMRGPAYALVLALVIAFGPFWARWCLRRPAS